MTGYIISVGVGMLLGASVMVLVALVVVGTEDEENRKP